MSLPMLLAVALVVIILAVLAVAGNLALRPRMLYWGATRAEAGRAMSGDDFVADPVLATTRAIDIDVGPEKVWPWLAQMGQGRGGFYSYEWLENLAGLDIHNSDRIISELQDLKPGDLIPFWRGAGVNAAVVEPPRLLVLAGTLNPSRGHGAGSSDVGGTWVFALEEPKAESTRMVVRSRVAGFQPGWLSSLFMCLLEPAHFVMERKMLRGIKDRAERESVLPLAKSPR
jgi:hypothetical protein